MDKKEELKKIHEKWFINCKCELKKTATQPVPGNGDPNAKIVFIGEAQGKSEDIEGRPFVGAAGKFLAEMLKNIWFKTRRNLYYKHCKISPAQQSRSITRRKRRLPRVASRRIKFYSAETDSLFGPTFHD